MPSTVLQLQLPEGCCCCRSHRRTPPARPPPLRPPRQAKSQVPSLLLPLRLYVGLLYSVLPGSSSPRAPLARSSQPDTFASPLLLSDRASPLVALAPPSLAPSLRSTVARRRHRHQQQQQKQLLRPRPSSTPRTRQRRRPGIACHRACDRPERACLGMEAEKFSPGRREAAMRETRSQTNGASMPHPQPPAPSPHPLPPRPRPSGRSERGGLRPGPRSWFAGGLRRRPSDDGSTTLKPARCNGPAPAAPRDS
ncbi:hypothetical protein MPTK1_2g19820 [Marchantia polymorpha subsp. ruderalis]|uniref:Uncharacterized protein n=1 Tax=Marchantia polymorpha TaxID=3197 RepID=A0A2R6WVB7_MARPO|nr:hypothetical protein MARPO_0055s0068 [Marchantia polymorpha]BBN02984.1 hypothetical protein Mp_2g19820 [Marchantia polymorpha subsp. ruderalis]|eukprot:PTQ37805.1 hypothetical protein MARPO_0055s0068 [Marchantia polymorpha]